MPMRSASVRNSWQDVRHDGPDVRPPPLAPLVASGPPRVDRSGTRRSPRGRPAYDPPRRREAALARLPGRGRARGRRRLSPGRRGRAPALAARRRRGHCRRGRTANGSVGVDRRDRRDIGPRTGQARAGTSHAPATQGQRAQRRHVGLRRRRSADRRRRARDHRGSLPRRDQTALRLRGEGRSGNQAEYRALRRGLQRPPLVLGRVRQRPRRLAHVPDRPDPRASTTRRTRPEADRARRRPGRLCQAAVAEKRC